MPEFVVSVTQLPLHIVSPAGQVLTQAPAEHACPVAQTLPHWPQLEVSVLVLAHLPLQLIWPAVQLAWHTPIEHVCAPGHAVPQPPQFLESVVTLVQMPRHEACPPVQPASFVVAGEVEFPLAQPALRTPSTTRVRTATARRTKRRKGIVISSARKVRMRLR